MLEKKLAEEVMKKFKEETYKIRAPYCDSIISDLEIEHMLENIKWKPCLPTLEVPIIGRVCPAVDDYKIEQHW